MALPRLLALVIGLFTALYFGGLLYRGVAQPIPFIVMLAAGGVLIAVAPRRAQSRAHRFVVAAAAAVYSLLCIAALAAFILLDGEPRDKALTLLLFFIGVMLTARAVWQATRTKRRKWDNYFDR